MLFDAWQLALRTFAGSKHEAKRFWFTPLVCYTGGNTLSQRDGDRLLV